MKNIKEQLEKTTKKWRLFGEGPHEEKRTRQNQKNNILGLLAGTPYPPRPLDFFCLVFSRFFWVSNFLIPKTWGILVFSFPWHLSILAGTGDILLICSVFACLFDLPAHLAKPSASLAPAPELSASQRQSCFASHVSFVLLRWDPSAMNSEYEKNIVEHLGP